MQVAGLSVMLAFLVACGGKKTAHLESDQELKVLTVEFNSGAPVPDLYVTLTDAATGDEIDSVIASPEGEAIFTGLEDGEDYVVAASTVESDVLGEGFTSVEQFTYESSKPYFLLQTHSARDYQQLDVPVVMQKPELPHGCEITSLTAVLNYYGVSVSKTEMAKSYLPKQSFRTKDNIKYGPDPNKAFGGNPANVKNGTYVFATPIVRAAEQVIAAKDASLRVTNVSGQSKEEIIQLVKQGIPVVVWVTLDLTAPRVDGGWVIEGTSTFHKMYKNLHAVVLTGYLINKVVVMDPLKGYVTYKEDQFFKSYKQLGMQAVAVHK